MTSATFSVIIAYYIAVGVAYFIISSIIYHTVMFSAVVCFLQNNYLFFLNKLYVIIEFLVYFRAVLYSFSGLVLVFYWCSFV